MATTSTPYSRRDERHTLPRELNARIEFDFPAGKRWRLDLLDLSIAGLAFALDQGRPLMEAGSRLSDVRVHVGDDVVDGDLVVLHVTRDAERRTICGALFHPSSQDQADRMHRVIERVTAD